jgi:hypothetical protein
MFGHGVFDDPDLEPCGAWAGAAGLDVLGAVVVGVVVVVAAAASAMPTAAPVVASAPATMVAPSSLEMCMTWAFPSRDACPAVDHLRAGDGEPNQFVVVL